MLTITPPTLLHVPRGSDREEERAANVDSKQAVEILGTELERRLRQRGSRVVDEHVEPAEAVHRLRDEPLADVVCGQVPDDPLSRAVRRQLLEPRPGLVLVVACVERERISVLLGALSNRPADAGIRSGHERNAGHGSNLPDRANAYRGRCGPSARRAPPPAPRSAARREDPAPEPRTASASFGDTCADRPRSSGSRPPGAPH